MTRHSTLTALLGTCFFASCVVLSGSAAADDDPIVAKGKRLAEANCAICHAIYATGTSPLSIAPPFRDIAVNYDLPDLQDAFNEGVATDHPAMPDWQMTPEQAEAIASYVMTLAPAGKKKTELEVPLQPLLGNP